MRENILCVGTTFGMDNFWIEHLLVGTHFGWDNCETTWIEHCFVVSIV